MDAIWGVLRSEEVWLILTLLVAGTLATDIWRAAGVYLSRGLKPDSPVILWVKDVSTALLAGLVARLIFFPPNALADVPVSMRIAAFISGLLVFFLSGRSLVYGLVYGLGVLVLLQWAFGI